MLKFIDISNWQRGLSISNISEIDAVIVKATEGLNFVDGCCDGWVQECIRLDRPWGFYHFARNNDANAEAEYFVRNCANYFGKGIPVLDLEDIAIADWDAYATTFCRRVHELTNVWCVVYVSDAYSNRLVCGPVLSNCGFWIAGYPKSYTGFVDIEFPYPTRGKNVIMWQFTSSGRLSGWNGNLDLDYAYLTKEQWLRYAVGDRNGGDNAALKNEQASDSTETTVLENAEYKVTVERKS